MEYGTNDADEYPEDNWHDRNQTGFISKTCISLQRALENSGDSGENKAAVAN